jgi:hypothetical protein
MHELSDIGRFHILQEHLASQYHILAYFTGSKLRIPLQNGEILKRTGYSTIGTGLEL